MCTNWNNAGNKLEGKIFIAPGNGEDLLLEKRKIFTWGTRETVPLPHPLWPPCAVLHSNFSQAERNENPRKSGNPGVIAVKAAVKRVAHYGSESSGSRTKGWENGGGERGGVGPGENPQRNRAAGYALIAIVNGVLRPQMKIWKLERGSNPQGWFRHFNRTACCPNGWSRKGGLSRKLSAPSPPRRHGPALWGQVRLDVPSRTIRNFFVIMSEISQGLSALHGY